MLRLFVSPESRAKAAAYMERMRKEGVDINDKTQRRSWIRRHRAEVSQSLPGACAGRIPSRNDHCPCGSHRKYKRCCGADKGSGKN